MELSDILRPGAVKHVSGVSSKKRLFNDLAAIAADVYGFDNARVCEALQERENLGPTGVGKGVALPHARMDFVDSVCGVFISLDKPIDFDSADKKAVDLVFALFAPENAGVDHLKALALVSRTLRDQSICAKLRANSEDAVIHTVLTEKPSTQAA